MHDLITVATDGSSRGNPGPAGWAWVESPDRWQAGSLPEASSIVAELTAIYRLLLTAPVTVPLRVLSDSQFAVNVCTSWRTTWRRNGWRKRDGTPVANRPLVAALDETLSARCATTQVEWVRAHNGHRLNEAADRLATGINQAAVGRGAQITGPGWRSRVTAGTAARQEVPAGGTGTPGMEFCSSCEGAINPLTLHCRCGSL